MFGDGLSESLQILTFAVVEHVPVGLALRLRVGVDGGRTREHAHGIARRRNSVHDDFILFGVEVALLHVVGNARLTSDRKARRHLHGVGPLLHEPHAVGPGEDAAPGDEGNRKSLLREVLLHVADDVGELEVRPVKTESQVAAGKRPLHHDEVRETLGLGGAPQEDVERPHGRNDDAELRIAKAGIIRHQSETRGMKTRGKADAVDSGVERRVEAGLERTERVVHGELFHDVDEYESVPLLRTHDVFHVALGGAADAFEIKVHVGLRGEPGKGFAELGLGSREMGPEKTVRDVGHHGVGDVADAAAAGDLERELLRGDVDPHAAEDDGQQLLFAEKETVVVETLVENGFVHGSRVVGRNRAAKKRGGKSAGGRTAFERPFYAGKHGEEKSARMRFLEGKAAAQGFRTT